MRTGNSVDVTATATQGPPDGAPALVRPALLVPRQLPPSNGAWINRTQELARLEDMAAQPRPYRCVLSGPGGIGKTALALRWFAHRGDDYPDGALYTDLSLATGRGTADVAPILAGWLHALGLSLSELPDDVEALAALYRSVTAQRSLHILVDNATSATQIRPLLPASPRSAVLVTSHHRLTSLAVHGFSLLDVGYFDPAAGAALLGAWLGPESAAHQDVLEALAHRLHGLPLAVTLAAAYLATAPPVCANPADLLDRLTTHPDAPLAPGMDTASLGELLTMTYDSLDPLAATLFRLTSLHPGTQFTAAPLAAALDADIASVRDALTRLESARMATLVAPERYEIPSPLRPGARELAEKHDADRTRRARRRAMVEWYLHHTIAADQAINPRSRRYSPAHPAVGTLAFPGAEQARAWFDLERATVLSSQHMAARTGWDDLVAQFAEALWNLLKPGFFAEDLAASQQRGILATRHYGEIPVAVFLARLGFAETTRGRYAAAIDACTRALESAQHLGDPFLVSMARSTRARAYILDGDPRAALDDLFPALADAERAGDAMGIALRLGRIGDAYAHPDIADYDRAIQHYTAAAEAMAELQDAEQEAHIRTRLAMVYLSANRPGYALLAMDSVTPDLSAWGPPRHRALACTTLGRIHAQLNNSAEARRCLRRSLEIYPENDPGTAPERESVLELLRELAAPDEAAP